MSTFGFGGRRLGIPLPTGRTSFCMVQTQTLTLKTLDSNLKSCFYHFQEMRYEYFRFRWPPLGTPLPVRSGKVPTLTVTPTTLNLILKLQQNALYRFCRFTRMGHCCLSRYSGDQECFIIPLQRDLFEWFNVLSANMAILTKAAKNIHQLKRVKESQRKHNA